MNADVGQRTVAVFGAREGSLGEAVAATVQNAPGRHQAVTIGISGDEDIEWSKGMSLADIFIKNAITDVVVTVGVNTPSGIDSPNFRAVMMESFFTNVQVPVEILQAAMDCDTVQSIVFISSNSAHIARTNSAAYCASKAALSMLVRVAAREVQGRPLIYAYEPGLLDGTPMTEDSANQWGGPLHRIPGLDPRRGLDVDQFADLIVGNLLTPQMALNGALIRLDGGEQ